MSLKNCRKGNHDLKEIDRTHCAYDEDFVVRWCQNCGAIVIDLEVDGRLFPGHYMKMKLPKLVKEIKNNDQ